tara:strand:- start:25371 stop:25664 length:294 start_codon:yes stop_codon:yes gene_type:complete
MTSSVMEVVEWAMVPASSLLPRLAMVITPSRVGALSMAPPSASLPNPHRLRQATLESILTTFIMKSALIVNPLLPYCRVDAEVALRRFEFHREEPIR